MLVQITDRIGQLSNESVFDNNFPDSLGVDTSYYSGPDAASVNKNEFTGRIGKIRSFGK